MQIDMHYYGTFAMAYAAGLKVDDAQIVATAAQLVDDNNLTSLHTLASGQGVLGVATAHHPVDAGLRVIQGPRDDDSRLIWVPFHFLPGAKGDSFEERVVCVKNSDVAREMVRYYTTKETVDAHRGHCLQLIGIAAHVYADTFSHYGFSGIASSLNGVDTKTIKIDGTHSQGIINYVRDKAKDFAERFGANVADTVKLGHGAVATYPDRPYLRWSYILQDGARFANRIVVHKAVTDECPQLALNSNAQTSGSIGKSKRHRPNGQIWFNTISVTTQTSSQTSAMSRS